MKLPTFASLFLGALFWTTAAGAADVPARKHVLILGDSISIGYTPLVQKILASEAVVMRPTLKNGRPENCSGTTFGVKRIDAWLSMEGGKWDVIHFNWGLHDLKHVNEKGVATDSPSDPPQATVEVYEKQLRELVAKLKATGAKLIFATTTPVPEGKMKVYRSEADVLRYNEAALKVMKENGVAVDDLHAFVKPREAELQLPVNVHYTAGGYQALAEEVSKAVRKAL